VAKPWERQTANGKRESSEAYAAFCAYRDLGEDRSIDLVSRQLRKSGALIARWSSRWGWVSRTDAWDDELDRRRRSAIEKEVAEMAKRQALQARVAANSVMVPVTTLLERLKEKVEQKKLSELDLTALIRLAALGARSLPVIHDAERKAYGLMRQDENETDGRNDAPADDIPDEVLADPNVAAATQDLALAIAKRASGVRDGTQQG
jgi:hypothetical protein